MMKAKNIQSIICLAIFFLFANQAWAAEWIYFDTASVGDVYYDKSSIKKVNKSILQVWNKDVLSKEAKTKYFSLLKEIHKAPKNPSMLSYYKKLMEIDCVNRKIKDISVIFYDEKGKVIYSSPKSDSGEWNDILPNTVGEKLINIVPCDPVTPGEPAVASNIEETATPAADAKAKEPDGSNVTAAAPVEAATSATAPAPVAVAAPAETAAPIAAPAPIETATPAVTDKNLTKINNKQFETKSASEKAVRNLLTKWLNSWKSGDMKTYRSCYASDFQSEVTYTNASVSYKTNVRQKNKKINISIDKLLISTDANIATAVFTQYYSSSILKYSGKKKLELRKIDDEWKIYREIM